MQYHIQAPQQPVIGTIELPTSKSISNRALILSALEEGKDSSINNLALCDDTHAMRRAFTTSSHLIDIGAAGTAMRFLTAYFAITPGSWQITGSERMKERPVGILVDALNSLGAHIRYLEKNGYPPLSIKGKSLKGGYIRLNGTISSQFISAILMIAPTMQDGLTIQLEGDIISKPYIKMTLQMMKLFGVTAKWRGDTITIPPQQYQGATLTVEADWSAASYWYSMVALLPNSKIKLPGLMRRSMQGDSKVAKIFESLGVATRYHQVMEIIHTGVRVPFLDYDFKEQPDLAQTVVVACCLLNVPFHFTGLQSLKIKETNRIAALIAECGKLGYLLNEPQHGELAWDGTKACKPAGQVTIDTYDDHRMAMAFAPAAFQHDIIINHPEVVSKSYPKFWDDLRKFTAVCRND